MTDPTEQDRVEKLRSIPLLQQLSDRALQEILKCAAEFEAKTGHVLVQPNQSGAGLFIIEEGSVSVELPGRKTELGPGEFFGELALLSADEKHTARVCASSPLKCLAIPRDEFDKLLDREPVIAVEMLKTVAKRLSERG